MKAAIYSPYLDSLGGGERYMMSFACVLRDSGWDTYVQSADSEILEKIKNRLGINTDGLMTTDNVKRGDGYDLLFWLSDGSVPTLFSRNNIVHFQRPFYKVEGRSLINRMKFFRINKVVVNSEFTKEWIDKEYPKESLVIYPPVDIDNFKPGKKENIILSVGRFSQLEQSKHQDILLDVFKKMYDEKNSVLRRDKWRLVFAGGSDIGRSEFLDTLIMDAKTYPVEILENPPFSKLKKLYSSAKVFWTASGFGVDGNENPEKLEHFGIVVVEAMAAGAIPFAYDGGGHKEIINNGENGYLWNEKEDLVIKMKELINNKSEQFSQLKRQAAKDSEKYSLARFEQQVQEII